MSDKVDKIFTIGILTIILVITISVLFACLIPLFGGLMPNYSDGERVGELIKISKKGVFWKSWEGQLVLSEFKIGDDGSNRFDFSCVDEEVGKEIEGLIGKRVVVKYNEYLRRPISQSTGYTVISIREAKK